MPCNKAPRSKEACKDAAMDLDSIDYWRIKEVLEMTRLEAEQRKKTKENQKELELMMKDNKRNEREMEHQKQIEWEQRNKYELAMFRREIKEKQVAREYEEVGSVQSVSQAGLALNVPKVEQFILEKRRLPESQFMPEVGDATSSPKRPIEACILPTGGGDEPVFLELADKAKMPKAIGGKPAQESERIQENVGRLKEELTVANAAKAELQLKLDELQTSIKYSEKKWEDEKEFLHNQNIQLAAELKAKTDELLVLAWEKRSEIVGLQYDLENKREEVSCMEKEVSELKKSNENLRKQVADLLVEVKEAKIQQQASVEERPHNEQNTHIELSNSYKSFADEWETKCKALCQGIQELCKYLKGASEANKEIQGHLVEMQQYMGGGEIKEKMH
ncbi:nucleoprotein TPR-like [Podarcis raffonei]|uniref:nucleoprotein TPR-like n=1 Tax=Podarcis raffonei TaxID=65483 RepID=UPI0023294CE3|nr:nucleoprotein TPR-like [Podarcis raffonei]